MGVTGNFDGLSRAASSVKGLSSVPRKMATIARSRVQRVVAREFRNAADPYGNAWAPLSPATSSKKRPLWGGDMRRSLTVRIEGDRLVLRIASPAQYHQVGRSNMPARPIFPTSASGLPASYVEALKQAATFAAGGVKPRET